MTDKKPKNMNIFTHMKEYLDTERKQKQKKEKQKKKKLVPIPKNIFSFKEDYFLYNRYPRALNYSSFNNTSNTATFLYKDSLSPNIFNLKDPNYSFDTNRMETVFSLEIGRKVYFLTLNENCVVTNIDTNGDQFELKFSLEKSVNQIFPGYELFISPSIQERINSISYDNKGNILFYNIIEKKFFIVFEGMNLYINENKKEQSDKLYYIIIGGEKLYFNHELYFKKNLEMKNPKE